MGNTQRKANRRYIVRGEQTMKLEKAIEHCFDRCNLIGTDCDVWGQMMRYKAIRELSEDQQDQIYDDLVHSLGFCR